MFSTLHPLLEILADPDHPAFAQALEQLTNSPLPSLNQADAIALLATLDQLIEHLRLEQTTTATRLAELRTQFAAAGAYQG
jgi:hypothetical protein